VANKADEQTIKVYVETGTKKVFAVSLEWDGWARSGKTEEAALDALADYAPRYAVVAKAAGQRFPARPGSFEVVERLAGNATTDFGAPSCFASTDRAPLTPRSTAVLSAAWRLLDGYAETAPEELRKGPRGGGRDRDKMLGHVLDSEAAYARKLGVKHKPPQVGDAAAIAALRADILAALEAGADGKWPARYAARRLTWHVLDHLWEMQDRSG
jgi:hypothetical protein